MASYTFHRLKPALIAGTALAVVATAVFAHDRGGRHGDRAEMHAERLGELDTNADGTVSAEEFAAGATARFARADQDGDGFLSADELMRHPRAEERAARMIAHLDRDGDGRISASEMPQDRFARLDRNGDGALTPDELRRPRGEHGRGMGPRDDAPAE